MPGKQLLALGRAPRAHHLGSITAALDRAGSTSHWHARVTALLDFAGRASQPRDCLRVSHGPHR